MCAGDENFTRPELTQVHDTECQARRLEGAGRINLPTTGMHQGGTQQSAGNAGTNRPTKTSTINRVARSHTLLRNMATFDLMHMWTAVSTGLLLMC